MELSGLGLTTQPVLFSGMFSAKEAFLLEFSVTIGFAVEAPWGSLAFSIRGRIVLETLPHAQ